MAAIAYLFLVRGGHSPPMVLVPAAILVWLFAHVMLWFAGRLAKRSSPSIFSDQPVRQRTPFIVVAVIVTTGLLAFASMVLTIMLMLRTGQQHQALVPAAIAAVSALLFAGLLLRKHWARHALILVLLGLTGWLCYRIGEVLLKAQTYTPRDLAFAIVMAVLLLVLGIVFLRSRRVRSYFTT